MVNLIKNIDFKIQFLKTKIKINIITYNKISIFELYRIVCCYEYKIIFIRILFSQIQKNKNCKNATTLCSLYKQIDIILE